MQVYKAKVTRREQGRPQLEALRYRNQKAGRTPERAWGSPLIWKEAHSLKSDMDIILQESFSWKEPSPSWFNTVNVSVFLLTYLCRCFLKGLLQCCYIWQVTWGSSQPSPLWLPIGQIFLQGPKNILIAQDDYIPNPRALPQHSMYEITLGEQCSPKFFILKLARSGFKQGCLRAINCFLNLLRHIRHIFLISVSS